MLKNNRQVQRHRRRFKIALDGAPAFTVDLSKGGFCVELMRVLRPGTPVKGVITLKGKEFPFDGRVAWSKAGDLRMNVRGRMGVEFTQVSNELTSLVEAELTGPAGAPSLAR